MTPENPPGQDPPPTPSKGDVLVTIGIMLRDIELLKSENERIWKIIKRAGSVILGILLAAVAFFWRNPDKWVQLVEFLR